MITGPRCERCQNRLISSGAKLCAECLNIPKFFDRMVCAFEYDDRVSKLIKEFKFHRSFGSGRVLIKPLIKVLTQTYEKHGFPKLIIPVPLHYSRLRARSFNQSRYMASILAKHLNTPVSSRIIKRNKKTPAQSTLSYKQRKENLKRVFTVDQHDFPDHIAIVDDVVTTCATVNQLAKCIKQMNPNIKIDIWGLARAGC